MGISESIHGVTELRMKKEKLENSSMTILNLEVVFRSNRFKPEMMTEKEITLFLADDFEVRLENKCPVFYDEKVLLLSAQETLKKFKNDSDVAQYIAELHGRLLAADPSFSLDG